MSKTTITAIMALVLHTILFSGCSKITHDVYVVNDAKKVGIVQPGDSAFTAF
jgi:hypothetical protein